MPFVVIYMQTHTHTHNPVCLMAGINPD